jgi:hypothetical protein
MSPLEKVTVGMAAEKKVTVTPEKALSGAGAVEAINPDFRRYCGNEKGGELARRLISFDCNARP